MTAQAVSGEGAMLNLMELAPGARVPRHSHPHEQLGDARRGERTLETVDGEHVLRPMDAYGLPGEIEHRRWPHQKACWCSTFSADP